MSEHTLNAELREDQGKGASRRLRRLAGKVPAIVYGGTKKPQAITLQQNEVKKAVEDESFFSHVVSLKVGDDTTEVMVKDLQRHPSSGDVMHADFMRVSKTKKMHVNVPLHFINESSCVGVKMGGGRISHLLTTMEVNCLAKDLPEFLEVDMAAVEVGSSVHLSDIALPKGVESVALSHGADHDIAVATVVAPKGSKDDEASEAAEGDAE